MNFSVSLSSPPERSRSLSELFWRRTDRREPGDSWRFFRWEAEARRRAAAELPRVRGPDVLLLVGAAEAKSCGYACERGALLSAKFLGEGGLFSQTARSRKQQTETHKALQTLRSTPGPSQRQLFTGWQSDKELRELPRRGVRRQGEQWPMRGYCSQRRVEV